MELAGYSLAPLRQDVEFILYRGARSNQTGSPSVLLRAPASTRPALETLRKIEREYALRDELDSAWAVRPVAISQQGGQLTLVLEDPGGETLDRILPGPLEITRFLRLAVGIARALSEVHKRELIHKDIKPANVLVNSATGEVRLMGFGIASRLPRERQSPEAPEVIAGTLPYMAPEQTGRMNRSIDSRSDLYSLGVTLYEMLTGSLPFTASDPMEWVHCHIARQPVSPSERAPNIPSPVSAIIMKLLAKAAEERYQTAGGLERDLRRCLDEWETQHRVDEFRLGEQDIPDRLLIPEKLYGRTSEINTLLASFDRVVAGGGPELVLVSGYSGIGKSAVVNELHKALVPPHGFLASGKFDQYKRDIPYSTLAQAFQSLIRPILAQSEEELIRWRDAIREALGPNGQLMVDLVPELKLIIGEQQPIPELPAQDSQNRFQQIFRRFVGVFARLEHPLALFLDDLQWLDAATLDLIEDLLTQPDLKYLLLIGAYRNNEVGPAHPLMSKLEAIRQAGVMLDEIVLTPLTREDMQQLIADAVHCEPDHTRALAELVHEKTTGTPFFAIQFLSELANEGLLAFNHSQGRWTWDLSRIRAKDYTDNVVDLLVGRFSRMPADTQDALKQLACLGNSADFTMLKMINGDGNEELEPQFWDAVLADLVLRSDDSYRFLHDRVQEAAYSLIPQPLRAQTHLRIGRLLIERTPLNELEERIFEIVNQFNRAAHLITSNDERRRVAELNLIAARRAKFSIAYASALSYLETGRGLLTEESWNTDYDLVFSLERLIAECELLTADMESAEKRLSMLTARANSAHDLALVTCMQLTLYTALDRLDRGVEICLKYLRRDGKNWSAHPTGDDVQREYVRIWSLLGKRKIEDLLDAPLVANPDILDILDVLTEFLTTAMFFDKDLCAFVICRMMNLSLEHGNSDASCFAYVWFGIIAGPRFDNYVGAFKFGQLGYDLMESRGLKRYEARNCLCFETVAAWTKHARHGRDLLRHAFDVAYRMSDFTYAAYSFTELITNFLVVGDPLAEAQAEAEKGVDFAKRARVGLAVDMVRSDIQLIRTLRGLTSKFGSFNDEEFDEAEFEQHLASNPALACAGFAYWILKVEARFFASDYTAAVDASLKAQQLLWADPTLLTQAIFRFYGALSHAAAWDSAARDERQLHLECLAAHHKQLQIWAEHCPENFENCAALADAEIARINGRLVDAEDLYEKAIRSAHANGFIHNEAVAYEIAARFYGARGFHKIADTYLREARYRYLRWGADGKVKQLDQLYPHIQEEQPTAGPTSTIVAPTEFLDLATVIKVSQAASGEIVLEKLIDKLMRAAIQHAGAERGLLILPRDVELQIEAEATTNGDDVSVHLRDASAAGAELPESLVRYVMRTQENVILEDTLSANSFSADPYILHHRARSVLCLPLMNQAKLIGVLYLENNLTPHVFTTDRITVLKVLASQAAVSLENTRLYRDLENREAEIRRLVEANVVGIAMWNLEGAITGANEAFLRMVQYDGQDLASGRVRWTDLTPAEWWDRDERAIAELKASGVFQPYEKECFRKDGSRVPVLLGGAFSEDSGNEGIAFILDLSEQKRAAEALRRSESYLAQAQRLAHLGSWVWELPARNALYLSEEWYRVSGFDPQDGMPTWEERLQRVHPEDRARWQATIDRAIAEKSDYDVEFRIVPPDAPVRFIHSVGRPVLDSSGELLQFIGVAMDVTERKRAGEALRSSEAYLMEAQRLTHTGSCAIDGTSREILYWSEEMFRLFGFDPQQGLPMWDQWVQRIHPEDRDNFRMAGERTFRENVNCDVEFRIVKSDGTVRHIHGTGHPVLSPTGELVQVLGTMVDITERRRADEARERLRQLEADLAHINRVSTMGELTASLAHEIKQPIGAAVTNAEACVRLLDRNQPDLPEALEAALEMVRDARRAADIIDRVRLLYQKGSPQLNTVDVNELVREMVIVLQHEARRHSVAIHIDLAEGLPKVMADRVQLQQVFMNLMLNGIEAIRDTTGQLIIKSQSAGDDQLLISITDSGVGLPAENIDKIFNAFFTTKSQGTGLGLAITRSIIESHGGRIWATTNSGRGATFHFTLPTRVAAVSS